MKGGICSILVFGWAVHVPLHCKGVHLCNRSSSVRSSKSGVARKGCGESEEKGRTAHEIPQVSVSMYVVHGGCQAGLYLIWISTATKRKCFTFSFFLSSIYMSFQTKFHLASRIILADTRFFDHSCPPH